MSHLEMVLTRVPHDMNEWLLETWMDYPNPHRNPPWIWRNGFTLSFLDIDLAWIFVLRFSEHIQNTRAINTQ